MKKILLLFHPGFEEIEAVTPADMFRRAGMEVTLASVTSNLPVTGGRGISVMADVLLADCRDQTFDMLFIPGGPGIGSLRKNSTVLDLIRKFHREGSFIAAICAAPVLLLDAGIAAGHVLTSFPGEEETLRPHVKAYLSDRVVQDGGLITSRGAGTAEEFALALIAILACAELAEDVRQSIVAR